MSDPNEKKPSAMRGRPRTFDRTEALEKALQVFWLNGFGPTGISQLCGVMGINPPSLYAAFGNKARLFLEAVNYYEDKYWTHVWDHLEHSPDIRDAVHGFYAMSADVLTSREAPCGCMVILGATNVSDDGREVSEALRKLRHEGRAAIRDRLAQAVSDGQIRADADIEALAGAMNALHEGMSIEARDGGSRDALRRMADVAVAMLPLA